MPSFGMAHGHGAGPADPLQTFGLGQRLGRPVGKVRGIQTCLGGGDDDQGSSGIEQRGLGLEPRVRSVAGNLQGAERLAGWEELAGGAAGRIEEADLHCLTRERDPGNELGGLRSVQVHALDEQLPGVGIADTHSGLAVIGVDPSVLERVGSDDCRAVSAVAAPIHHGLFDAHLGEGVVDVDAGFLAGAEDDSLARRRAAAADTIDLARVGGAEETQKHLVGAEAWNFERTSLEDPAFAGTPAHPGGLNRVFHWTDLIYRERSACVRCDAGHLCLYR
jgi:hypothetical protein